MSVFRMPSLGADMEDGKLVEWLVAPGDHVARGDIIAVVETQKGAIEIEIFEPGEVTALIAEPGQTLPVGAPLARLRAPGDDADDDPALPETTPPDTTRADTTRAEPHRATADPVVPAPPDPAPPPPDTAQARSGPPDAVLASPAAKARAAEARVELNAIRGTGPGSAVLLADVERHLSRHASAPDPDAAAKPASTSGGKPPGKPGLDMAEMRRAIAAAMTRSKREIPHYYLSHQIDLQPAQEWLSALNAGRVPDRRVLMGALLIRATVRALRKVPELNGRHDSGEFTPATAVHCGLAVAMRGGGLIAPAIMNAQDMDIDSIMAAMRDTITRTRTGRLRNSEITEGTITVSSLGESGADALFGVIYPPQVALVGFGAPRVQPMVRAGTIMPRLGVTASLAADHRISDGRRGALFLSEIDRLLQEPETL